MIGYLSGGVLHVEPDFIILETGGVGYKVYTSGTYAVGEQGVSLWVYTAVREDAITLFGFMSYDELTVFERLLTVPGVGPKSALNVLTVAGVTELVTAAREDDPARLTKISGIGKKTAEKIVVELRDKLDDIALTTPVSQRAAEALEALLALGYTREEARSALQSVDAGERSVSEIVRDALRALGRNS